jgi:hypothetical protein
VPKFRFGGHLLAACLVLPTLQATATELALPVTIEQGPAVQASAAIPAGVVLAANSIIELEMVDTVSSVTSKRGDFFKLRVAVDVKSGDAVLIAAGTPVVGQVVHAAAAGNGGKGGELILAARYLELPQGQVKLRGSFGAAGKNRVGAALTTAVFGGPFGMMVRGKESVLPAGSALSAKLANDTSISP